MRPLQKATFPDGGFVLHKIPFSDKNTISAWYDKKRKLIDAEFSPSERKIKEGGPAWDKAADYGRIWG